MSEFGAYELLEEVGRGGMSVVHRARNRASGVEVALKLFAPEFAPPAPLLRLMLELVHPNVVRVLEAGETGGTAFVAMEFVPGPTFDRAIRKHAFGPRESAAIVAAVGRGLQCAHDRGIVHRDIKPGNVLLMPDGTPKLSDFGLAKVGVDEAARKAGVTAGTPMYMSPEQATGMSEVVDPKSDVYSLGVLLYEAVTGRVPFDGADTLEILRRVANEAPPSPRTHLPSIDRTLEGIILRAMAKDPALRYATAVAMSEDLERWALGKPLEAPRVVTLPPEPGRRLPVLPIAIFGFVAVIALLIGALALISRGRTEASLEDVRREAAELSEAGGREVELARRALYRPGVPDTMPVELDRAMTTLKKSLNLHETAEAHHQMGRAHALLRRPDEAMREYRRALALAPDHLGASIGIARLLCEEIFESVYDNRTIDADAVRAEIARLERRPEPEARVHALLLKREFRDAAQRASELARSRNDEEYAYLTGMAFCAAKLYDTSKAWLKRAIEACPNFYEARHARGHVHAELGEADAAIADFRAAGAVPPAQSSMVAHEAQLLSRIGRLPEAIGALDRAIALRPDARLFFDRAQLHEKARNPDAAARDYGEAIKHWPEWTAAWAARAALWLARGMMSDALADAEQAVKLGPKDAGALLIRGTVRLNANDPKGAHADFSAAVDANPWTPAAYAGRARASLRLLQYRVADDDFTRAIGMGGSPEPAWYLERAMARLEIGKWEDARNDADEYLRLLPGGPSAHEANRIKEEARRRLEGS